MKKILAFLIIAGSTATILAEQTTFYAAAFDQPPAALGGEIITRISLENTGQAGQMVRVEFVDRLEQPRLVTQLGALSQNCGIGCFDVQLNSGQVFSGDSPGTTFVDDGFEGYVRITASSDIQSDVEIRREPDCVSSVPGRSAPLREYVFPVSWDAAGVMSSVYIGIILEEGTFQVQTLLDNSGNVVEAPEGFFSAVGWTRGILSQSSAVPGPFEGQLRVEADRPFFAFVADVDLSTLCATFPEQAAQAEVTRVNLPTAILGEGLSTDVLIGAGADELTVDATFYSPDGRELATRSVAVPSRGVATLNFTGGNISAGSLDVQIAPSTGHFILSEIISIFDTPPVGSPPAPLCEEPELLLNESAGSSTGAAFSNPFSIPVNCSWEVLDAAGLPLGFGAFPINGNGQTQFFPAQQIGLPVDFVGTLRGRCSHPVHVFSLFQRSDLVISSNTSACFETAN